jgi:hypothetical protein
MIPDIGLIIGTYVITRMLQLLNEKGASAPNNFLKACAILTILATFFAMYDLIFQAGKILGKP